MEPLLGEFVQLGAEDPLREISSGKSIPPPLKARN
jgi:hypothetical protein